jgi:hypothetical protein
MSFRTSMGALFKGVPVQTVIDELKEMKAAKRKAAYEAGIKARLTNTPPLGNNIRGYNYRKQRSQNFFTDCNSFTPKQARRMRKHANKVMGAADAS